MNGNSSNDGQKRDLDDAIEGDPQSKHGDEGKSVNGGDQAGPNCARSWRADRAANRRADRTFALALRKENHRCAATAARTNPATTFTTRRCGTDERAAATPRPLKRSQGASRPPRRAARTNARVIVGDPVEREGQHELAGARRPAKRGFGIPHPFAGADDAPQDVGQARTGCGDRSIEAALGIELRAVEVRVRPIRRGPARPAPSPRPWSPGAPAAPAPNRVAAVHRRRTGAG